MPATTTHGLPYPVAGDPPAGHTQIQTLAGSLDTQLLTTVTSLPGSPVDGQRCLFLADSANSVVWDLRYRSASPNTQKWEFIGGSPMRSVNNTQATYGASTSYGNPTVGTAGPSVTVPVAGVYRVLFGASGFSGVGDSCYVSYSVAGATPLDAVAFLVGTVNASSAGSRESESTIASASTFAMQVRMTGGTTTATFVNRWISVTPIRLG